MSYKGKSIYMILEDRHPEVFEKFENHLRQVAIGCVPEDKMYHEHILEQLGEYKDTPELHIEFLDWIKLELEEKDE